MYMGLDMRVMVWSTVRGIFSFLLSALEGIDRVIWSGSWTIR